MAMESAPLTLAPATPSRRQVVFVRILPPAVYLGLAAAVFERHGVPVDRGLLSLWILGGLLCVSLGSLSSFVRSVVLEWLPLLAALTLYDVLRGLGGGRVPIHGGLQIWLDRHVFGLGAVPSVWLQQHLWHAGRPASLDYGSYAVYMTYYLFTPLLLGTLWLVDRALFRRYARQLTLLAFAALAFFTAAPTIPPWLASQKDMIGPTTRLIGPIGTHVQWFDVSPLWERGVRLADDLAAFPSLHQGMTVLAVIVLWRRVGRAVRVLLVGYALAMAFALVYTAEHYVTDLVAGTGLALLVACAEPRLVRWLAARRARQRAALAPELAPESV
jgi:hypothetical protein